MSKKNKNWKQIHQDALHWAKWMSLYEAVNMIADKAEEKNISFQNIEIKPLAVYKYMESTENIFLRKILKQEYNIDVCFNDLPELDSVTKNIKPEIIF